MIKFKKSFAKYKDPNGNMLDLGVLFGMGNFVTPQMFGAKGDGTENAVNAFQSALDALREKGGGSLFIPNGTYDLTGGEIVVYSNINIIGDGFPRLFTKTTDGTGYFSIFRNDDVSIENVTISGLFIDQWEELETDIQPNNEDSTFCAITFLGRCKNIYIHDNIINSIGGWAISVTDTVHFSGSENVSLVNNRVNWKQAGDGTWYDASALYVESMGHVIRDNTIEALRPEKYKGVRWKIEGGIETHGVGVVTNNVIKNAFAGINVVDFAYRSDVTNYPKREVSNNRIEGVSKGIFLYTPKAPKKLCNIDMFNNEVKVIAEDIYTGFAGVSVTLADLLYTDEANNYTGDLECIKIFDNTFSYGVNNYTESVYTSIMNAGAIALTCNGTLNDIEVYGNRIENFPFPAVLTYQHDSKPERYHTNIIIRENYVIDCGYGMSNEYQNVVFYTLYANNVFIHDNVVKWKKQNNTKYLVGGTYNDNMIFTDNKQISENGFTITGYIGIEPSESIILNTENKYYREITASPIGVLTPYKIGEIAFDTNRKRWYIATGTANTDWLLMGQAMGQITMSAGKTSVAVPHGLVYLPRNIVVTPHGNLGNVWVDEIYTSSFTIHCSSAPGSNVEISWRAEI